MNKEEGISKADKYISLYFIFKFLYLLVNILDKLNKHA